MGHISIGTLTIIGVENIIKAKRKLVIIFLTIFLVIVLNQIINRDFEMKGGDKYDNTSELLENNRNTLQGIQTSQEEIFHDDINTNYWDLVNVSNSYFETSNQQNYQLDNSSAGGVWNYTGNSYYLGDQDIFPEGFYWDGVNWWMIGSNTDRVYKYYSNWTYSGVSYAISGQFTTPTDIFWDGTNWWGLGDGTADRVYKYDSNWVYTGTSHHIGGQEPAAKGIFWDGMNWWLVGLHNRVVYKFNSDWSYAGESHYIGGQMDYPSDLYWDGVNWLVPGIYNNRVYLYNSDWNYTGSSFDLGGLDLYPTDVFWEGNSWWMLGYENSRVFQYGTDLYNVSKNYFGNGYMYMQTNTSETIALRSVNYGTHYNLSNNNYFEIEFETNSDSQIDLILLKDGLINETLILSQSGNNDFSRHTRQIIANKDIEFDQIKISGTLEDTDYVKIYDIKAEKDTTPPTIIINTPSINRMCGSNAPDYNITILETNLDSIWYRLDNGTITTENFTLTDTNGFIKETLWDSIGNGTVTIQFFANDTLGNIGSSEIAVRKDILSPIISINSPLPNTIFRHEPPNFTISVSGINLESTWYTINNGITNYTFTGLTSVINPSAWSAHPDGKVSIIIYLNNSNGIVGLDDIKLIKDTLNPQITVISPLPNELFGASAPDFNVEIEDANGIDTMWYSIDNGENNYTFTTNNTINQVGWDLINNTMVSIIFYANDSTGQMGLNSISIRKDMLAPLIQIHLPLFKGISGKNAPKYNITITDNNLDTIWYTIERGSKKYIITELIGSLDQSVWNSLPEGIVNIRFFANDTIGNTYFKDVVVYKDLSGEENLILINNIIGVMFLVLGLSLSVFSAFKAMSAQKRKKPRPKPMSSQKVAPIKILEYKDSKKKQVGIPILKEEVAPYVKTPLMKQKKEILCPFCGTANLKGWKFCTTCGKHMKPEKVSIDTSEFLGGFIISLIGGLSSIALGFGIPLVYPELVHYMEDAMLILQTIMIIGGIVSIIGAILIFSKPKLGGAIVLTGGFIAGINIITVIGASRIFKKIRS